MTDAINIAFLYGHNKLALRCERSFRKTIQAITREADVTQHEIGLEQSEFRAQGSAQAWWLG